MHTYKFSRDIIFADDHFLSTLIFRCIVTVVTALKNFEDLIFVDDNLPMKAAKMISLENCTYAAVFLIRSYGALNGARGCFLGQ